MAQAGSGATINQVTQAYQDPNVTFDPGGRLMQLVFQSQLVGTESARDHLGEELRGHGERTPVSDHPSSAQCLGADFDGCPDAASLPNVWRPSLI